VNSQGNAAAKMAMAKGSRETKSDDKLNQLKTYAKKARDLNDDIVDLQAQLATKNAELYTLTTSTMPDLMAQIGVDNIGVPQEGNHLGVDFELKKAITANIAAGWDEERRAKGFATLKKYNADGLIKTEVTAMLPKGQLKAAKQIVAAAKKLGIKMELKQSVHNQTLSAWLREFYDSKRALSTVDLEALGAFVGFVVKPKERKQ
jgi:hypothetical protein